MKKWTVFAASACFGIPVLAQGDSPFDGTWKLDVGAAELPTKPDVYLLKDGMYHCDTCAPPVSVMADGHDQKVVGHPYFDTEAVRVVDDHAVEINDKKAGKVVITARMTVSADGNTATLVQTDSTAPNGTPVTSRGTLTRVLRGAPGSHLVSGSWRVAKIDNISDNGLLVTYKVDGNKLQMSNPLGQSYSAALDGTDAPFMGDPGITTVSVKGVKPNMIEETDKRDGKAIWIGRMAVSADGHSMIIMWIDNLHGTTGSINAKKL